MNKYPNDLKPLMAAHHIGLLVDSVPEGGTLLEWGSGGTSILLIQALKKKGARLISIEHDGRWYQNLKRRVVDLEAAENWTGIHVPVTYSGENATESEESPAGAADYIAEGFKHAPDVVLVDGIARGAILARYHADWKEKGTVVWAHDAHRDWYEWAVAMYSSAGLVRHAPGEYAADIYRLVP